MAKPYRSAQEAKVGKTLQEQMRSEVFRMRGRRAYLFQAAADRIDALESSAETWQRKYYGESVDCRVTNMLRNEIIEEFAQKCESDKVYSTAGKYYAGLLRNMKT